MITASHNLMSGLRLAGLIREHLAMRDSRGLDLLCIQENDKIAGGRCAGPIAAALGRRYRVLADPAAPRLAMIYDSQKLRCLDHEVIALPRLARLNRFERLYIAGGRVTTKHAQLAVFARDGGAPLTAVNFHLDTAGGNAHRRDQVAAISAALDRRGDRAVIACGDTNAFAWRRQLAKLAAVLGPLISRGAVDPGRRPTHYFARQGEPKLAHRTAAALGRLGIDIPGRYDVVCTSLETRARGQLVTPDSDHDLVWAQI
jgi:endonuclease/exonuclease/phosphatase family metal-dependent hydrolase